MQYWSIKIEAMENDIRSIEREERNERALRLAEQEANRAMNRIVHEADILSRPGVYDVHFVNVLNAKFQIYLVYGH